MMPVMHTEFRSHPVSSEARTRNPWNADSSFYPLSYPDPLHGTRYRRLGSKVGDSAYCRTCLAHLKAWCRWYIGRLQMYNSAQNVENGCLLMKCWYLNTYVSPISYGKNLRSTHDASKTSANLPNHTPAQQEAEPMNMWRFTWVFP